MNKKGVPMIKMIIFLVGSLIIGALVIAAFASIVPRLMSNVEEKIASKDIALTLMTLSASPNDIFYRYDKNVEDYEIRINQEEVNVKSNDGAGKYKYIQMNGVTVVDALISNTLMIPMALRNGKLSFEDEKVDYSDACAIIPSDYGRERIKVKVDIYYGESPESKGKLEEIKALMKIYSIQSGSKIDFVEDREDLILNFATGSSPSITYYEDTANQKNTWYQKISCYSSRDLKSLSSFTNLVGETGLNPSSEEEITIIFGDSTKFIEALSNDPSLSSKISKSIYDSISLGIMN